MSLGHLSILLTHYGEFCMHVYRGHAAGTNSQPTQTIKHSRGNTSQGLVAAVNYCFAHMPEGCSGRLYQMRAAGTTSNCAHTFANAAIACPGDMKAQSNPVSYIRDKM